MIHSPILGKCAKSYPGPEVNTQDVCCGLEYGNKELETQVSSHLRQCVSKII